MKLCIFHGSISVAAYENFFVTYFWYPNYRKRESWEVKPPYSYVKRYPGYQVQSCQ